MTATFSGDPAAPSVVFVKPGKGRARKLDCPGAAWGVLKPGSLGVAEHGAGSLALARLLLVHVIGKGDRVDRLARRFQYRAVATMPTGAPWSITDDRIRDVCASIEQTEVDTAQTRTMVAQEPPRMIVDRATVPDGAWDQDHSGDYTKKGPRREQRARKQGKNKARPNRADQA